MKKFWTCLGSAAVSAASMAGALALAKTGMSLVTNLMALTPVGWGVLGLAFLAGASLVVTGIMVDSFLCVPKKEVAYA